MDYESLQAIEEMAKPTKFQKWVFFCVLAAVLSAGIAFISGVNNAGDSTIVSQSSPGNSGVPQSERGPSPPPVSRVPTLAELFPQAEFRDEQLSVVRTAGFCIGARDAATDMARDHELPTSRPYSERDYEDDIAIGTAAMIDVVQLIQLQFRNKNRYRDDFVSTLNTVRWHFKEIAANEPAELTRIMKIIMPGCEKLFKGRTLLSDAFLYYYKDHRPK